MDELAWLFSCPELAGLCDDSYVREAVVDRDVKLGAKRRLLELWGKVINSPDGVRNIKRSLSHCTSPMPHRCA